MGPGTDPVLYRAPLRDAIKKGRLAIDDDTGVTFVLRHEDIRPLPVESPEVFNPRRFLDPAGTRLIAFGGGRHQ